MEASDAVLEDGPAKGHNGRARQMSMPETQFSKSANWVKAQGVVSQKLRDMRSVQEAEFIEQKMYRSMPDAGTFFKTTVGIWLKWHNSYQILICI